MSTNNSSEGDIRRRYHREVRKLKNQLKKTQLYSICMTVAFVALCAYSIGATSTSTRLSNQIDTLEGERIGLINAYLGERYDNTVLTDYADAVTESVDEVTETVAAMEEIITDMEEQNAELFEDNAALYEQNLELNEALNDQNKQEETMTHYSYCLYDTGGKRNDITYNQLITMESAAEAKGIDPDLVMSIVMVESEGHERCTNSASTARGYGQFLSSTGKMVYEDLMGNGKGTYSHDMAFNGDLNLRMMVAYLSYLRNNSSSWYGAIMQYRGRGGSVLDSYIGSINKYLAKVGKSFYSL